MIEEELDKISRRSRCIEYLMTPTSKYQDIQCFLPDKYEMHKPLLEGLRLVGYEVSGADDVIAPNFNYHNYDFSYLMEIPYASMRGEIVIGYHFPFLDKFQLTHDDFNDIKDNNYFMKNIRNYDSGEHFIVFQIKTMSNIFSVLWSVERILIVTCTEPCEGVIRDGKFFITSDVSDTFVLESRLNFVCEKVQEITYDQIDYTKALEFSVGMIKFVLNNDSMVFVDVKSRQFLFGEDLVATSVDDGKYRVQRFRLGRRSFQDFDCRGQKFSLTRYYYGEVSSVADQQSFRNEVSIDLFSSQYVHRIVPDDILIAFNDREYQDMLLEYGDSFEFNQDNGSAGIDVFVDDRQESAHRYNFNIVPIPDNNDQSVVLFSSLHQKQKKIIKSVLCFYDRCHIFVMEGKVFFSFSLSYFKYYRYVNKFYYKNVVYYETFRKYHRGLIGRDKNKIQLSKDWRPDFKIFKSLYYNMISYNENNDDFKDEY